jgi:hypothetical protein
MNHPSATYWAWKRSIGARAQALPGRRPATVPLDVSQAQVARASYAIYKLLKVGNTDALVLARAALLAATREPGKWRGQRRQDGGVTHHTGGAGARACSQVRGAAARNSALH